MRRFGKGSPDFRVVDIAGKLYIQREFCVPLYENGVFEKCAFKEWKTLSKTVQTGHNLMFVGYMEFNTPRDVIKAWKTLPERTILFNDMYFVENSQRELLDLSILYTKEELLQQYPEWVI